MRLFDTSSLSSYLLRNLHGDHYEDHVAALNGYTNAVEDRLMQTVPVIQTNLEGADKRIIDCIKWNEWLIEEVGKLDSTLSLYSLHTMDANLQYIGVFLDRLNDHIEAAKNPQF